MRGCFPPATIGVPSSDRDPPPMRTSEPFPRHQPPTHAPDSPEYERLRQPWTLGVDQRPAAVAEPVDVAEVAALVRQARTRGWRIAVQATGHGATTLGALDDVLLLRTTRLRGVHVDAARRIAHVSAGTTSRELAAAAAEHGLAANVGMAGGVGVVGSLLGGGLGWLSRRHGLGAAQILAVDLVTADGGLVRVDAEHDPELLWALRGGGEAPGIVVGLDLTLHEQASVHAGALLWPIERAGEILRAWRDWTAIVPDELTSVGRLLWAPPRPEVPEPMRGRGFVLVEAASLLGDHESAGLLAPLRALGPELDSVARIPAPQLERLHMDPPEPVPAVLDHLLLDTLEDEAIDAIARAAVPPVVSVELRQLGGALRLRQGPDGAGCGIDGAFLLNAVALFPDPAAAPAAAAGIGRVTAAAAPWDSGRRYGNFVERPAQLARTLPAEVVTRLAAVRAAWDPEGRFVSARG